MDKKTEDLLREVIFILNDIVPNTSYWYREERTNTFKLVNKVEDLIYKEK